MDFGTHGGPGTTPPQMPGTTVCMIFELIPSNLSVAFIFLKFISVFYWFWLHWVFRAVGRLSLVAESWGSLQLQCTGFSSWWLLLFFGGGAWALG